MSEEKSDKVLAIIARMNEISVELSNMGVPFSLFINPYGFEFDDSGKDFYSFIKLHKVESTKEEQAQQIAASSIALMESYVGSSKMLWPREIGDSRLLALASFDRASMKPLSVLCDKKERKVIPKKI